jgi:hypothetical protein
MTTSEQIMQVIDDIAKRFGIALDYTKDNIVPQIERLAERYATYKLSISIYAIVVGMVFMLAAAIMLIKLIKKANVYFVRERWGIEATPAAVLLITLVSVFGAAGLGLVLSYIAIAIKAATLPELVFFDYIRSILR